MTRNLPFQLRCLVFKSARFSSLGVLSKALPLLRVPFSDLFND